MGATTLNHRVSNTISKPKSIQKFKSLAGHPRMAFSSNKIHQKRKPSNLISNRETAQQSPSPKKKLKHRMKENKITISHERCRVKKHHKKTL